MEDVPRKKLVSLIEFGLQIFFTEKGSALYTMESLLISIAFSRFPVPVALQPLDYVSAAACSCLDSCRTYVFHGEYLNKVPE